MIDDSSEEEWTYTSARQSNPFVISEQRKTNVVVRLDFDESPRIDLSEKIHFAHEKNADLNRELTFVEDTHNREAQQEDSDDEKKSDKSSIQRLIKEVENLIGEERHTIVSRTFPQLVFDEKDITNNHRAKYARVKEWLKLNASRSHEGKSQVI